MIDQSYNHQSAIIPAVHISLDTFLTVHCKDAIKLDDFLNLITVTKEDIMYTIQVKNTAEGYYTIINNQLRLIDVTKRPFHCNDTKRHVNYMFTSNGWEKEKTEDLIVKTLYRRVRNAFSNKIVELTISDPEYLRLGSELNDVYILMIGVWNGYFQEYEHILGELSKLTEERTHLNKHNMLKAIRRI